MGKKELQRQSADLKIELNVSCPGCGEYFDLFKTPENEEGDIYHMVLDDDRWLIPEYKRLDIETRCPRCKLEFRAKGINW